MYVNRDNTFYFIVAIHYAIRFCMSSALIDPRRACATRVTVVVPLVCVCVCVCMFVVFCHHAHVRRYQKCRSQQVHHSAEKTFIIVVLDKNALLRIYSVICLPLMLPTTLKHQKTDTKGIDKVGKTLICTILTKNCSIRSYSTFAYRIMLPVCNFAP